MSTKPSANGWPVCMVQAHIDITTAAVPSSRSRRKSERRAWISLLTIIASLLVCGAWLGWQ
ncbi:hypothetical protein LJB71_08170 [Thermomonas sp. S9]|uniref:hypothetical protein n=1 Tax=Thermomonas sp. S9 TaxID=2885203 RepID=UPI00216ADADE|nr:hypothetical protein [Thermomonas sp. S9]MCR6496190.1 hypothetical protein [Thermomonas sp. S9]